MKCSIVLSILLTTRSLSAAITDIAPTPTPYPSTDVLVKDSVEVRASLQKRAADTCPEDVGASLYSCSADFCGGETSGRCKKINCKCNKDDPASSEKLTTVTKTVSGTAVTGTFALQTISEYSGLAKPITTTVSSKTTSTDGSTGVETAVAIILVGGAIWLAPKPVPFDPPTDGGGGGGNDRCPETEPPCSLCGGIDIPGLGMCTIPPFHFCPCSKAKRCPSTKPDCSSCGGQDGLCQKDENTGCECKENCPPSDKLECSSEACRGNDQNKCQNEHKDCECKPAKCPDGKDTPRCKDCGGDNGRKCKGIDSQNGKYKDCYCMDDIKPIPLPVPDDIKDGPKVQKELKALPAVSTTSYSIDPDLKPLCQKSTWSAPQQGTSSVGDAIKSWCKEVNGKKVKKQPGGTDKIFKMFPQSYYSFWLSASNWYDAPKSFKCDDEVTVSEDECTKYLNYAVKGCDSSDVTHGAGAGGLCIYYNITLDYSQNIHNPPWNRLSVDASQGSCDRGKSSGVSSLFWNGIYPKFCEKVSKDPKTPLTMTLTPDDFKLSKTRSLHLWPRTPPPAAGQYQGQYGQSYKFDFEWSGANGDCRKSCEESMAVISLSCGQTGNEQNSIASKATFDAGCGQYTITNHIPDPDEVYCRDINSNYNANHPKDTFSVDQARDAINAFCEDDKAMVSNPEQHDTYYSDYWDPQQWNGYPERHYPIKGNDSSMVIYAAMASHWAATGQFRNGKVPDWCPPEKNFYVKDYKDRCKELLNKAVNNCNTNTETEKHESYVWDWNGENGCVAFDIYAYKEPHYPEPQKPNQGCNPIASFC